MSSSEQTGSSVGLLQTRHSDDVVQLLADVERALCASGYQSLCAVDVALHDEVVFLRGCVPSYYMKQIAQSAALVVSGVREVRNELSIAYMVR